MFKIYTVIFCLFCANLSAEIIQKLSIEGNSRIGEETIKVYGDIAIGKDYTALGINEILKKLYETNFFEDIKINLNNGVLTIAVKEYPIINYIDIEGEKSNTIKKFILEKLNLRIKESFIRTSYHKISI